VSIGIKKVKKNGKVYVYPRNYKTEYKERTQEQKDNRGKRAEARNKMIEKHGEASLKGKDVDHKRGIKAGNGESNLRILSPKKNRSRKSTKWR
jgi:hypothetical protein